MGQKISNRALKKITKKNHKINKFLLFFIIAIIVIGTILVALLNKKNDIPDTKPYVTIGDVTLTQTEYVFYYTLTVNNYISVYSDYLDYVGLDTSKEFSKQYYDIDNQITWHDYFIDLTNSLIQTTISLYNDANKNNYSIKDDDFYDTFIDGLKTVASDQDYTYEQYLKHIFIDTMTPTVLEKELNIYCIALNYSEYLEEKFKEEITDEEITDLYNSNPDYFDSVSYRAFSILYDSSAENDDLENDVLTYKTAYEHASNVSKAQTEEEFELLSVENALESLKDDYKKEDSTLVTVNSKANLYSNFQDWMYDSSRKFGDTTIIEDESKSAIYVVFFINRKLNNDNSVNFRHILLTTDTYGNEDDLEVAAKGLYQQWKNNGASENDFIEYANTYSEDTTIDGLYENSMKGDVIDDIDNWLFSDERKYGDYTLIKTDIGYHILFYIGQDEPYWKSLARNSIADTKYDEYVDFILENNTLNFVSGDTYNINEEATESNLIENIDIEEIK